MNKNFVVKVALLRDLRVESSSFQKLTWRRDSFRKFDWVKRRRVFREQRLYSWSTKGAKDRYVIVTPAYATIGESILLRRAVLL